MNSSTPGQAGRRPGRFARQHGPDPRLSRVIESALGDAARVVNVGAGAGNYEPAGRTIAAVEPSADLVARRRPGAARVVRGRAEALPLADGCCDASLAILSLHNWSNWQRGLAEMRRIAVRRVVILTWDPREGGFWLLSDYLPDLLVISRQQFPSLDEICTELGGETQVLRVPIPHDCTDGFLGAYWRRPASYLDPAVRRGIASLAGNTRVPPIDRLRQDLASGHWDSKYKHLLEEEALDIGYRIVIGPVAS